MRLLLDTHALLWWLEDDTKLSSAARQAIGDEANEVAVSAVSAFETALKHRVGKLPEVGHLARDFERIVADQGFIGLPVTLEHGRLAGDLPLVHKDPFDRLLIAQGLSDGLAIVSNERLFDGYGVQRLW